MKYWLQATFQTTSSGKRMATCVTGPHFSPFQWSNERSHSAYSVSHISCLSGTLHWEVFSSAVSSSSPSPSTLSDPNYPCLPDRTLRIKELGARFDTHRQQTNPTIVFQIQCTAEMSCESFSALTTSVLIYSLIFKSCLVALNLHIQYTSENINNFL